MEDSRIVTGLGTGKGGNPPAILEMDHVFEALAHPRRRYLLYTLLEDTEWSLEAIAVKVAGWEQDVSHGTVSDEEAERVYVSLYHNHIPRLVDEGIIEFDVPTETIRPGPHAEQVLSVLETTSGSYDSGQEAHARRTHNEGCS